MGMRRSGFDPNRWGRWWPAVVVRGAKVAHGGGAGQDWRDSMQEETTADLGWRSRDISTAPAAMASLPV